MQGKLKCAIYTRVSTDNQAEVEFNSCEAQEEKIKSFIKSQENMEVFKVYSDPGFTGANLNRPALNELLNDIKEHRVNLVISYKIDRLTRSPKDFYQLIELFDKYGVDFISVTERFDTSTPSGRLLRNIMLTFAQFERELTSERTKDKMLQRASKGRWNGGLVPFGYKVVNKKLVIKEEDAKIVKNIFESYVSSGSLISVCKELKGNQSKSHISYILRNIIYTGKIKYAGKVTGYGRNRKYAYYNCITYSKKGKNICPGHSVRADELDEEIIKRIKSLLFSDENMKKLLDDINAATKSLRIDYSKKITELKKKANDLQLRITRQYEAIESGAIDVHLVAERLKALKLQKDALQEEISYYESLSSQNQPVYITRPMIDKYRKEMEQIFMGDNVQEKRDFLKKFIEKIIVKEGEIEIVYYAPGA